MLRNLRFFAAGALGLGALALVDGRTKIAHAGPAPWLEKCAMDRGKTVAELGPADMADQACWPNDENYGYVAGKPNERKSGQWPFYSFIPDRSPGAPPMRPEETAAGMSIDLAWRRTIGDDRVLIAVLDSGIKWASVLKELVDLSSGLSNKAFINRGELATHPPHLADGSVCTGLGGFDCNLDGVFDVRDYAEEPSLTPAADADRPLGDRNRNGLLDPEDLILNFSDEVDDDGNGYLDDISGWDFYKNDNDPFDDTHYLHGTEEASWSSAQTNDGAGDAGVCPLCRVLPLRVGDSFIADAQDFSKAVLYAVDNDVTIIQEALGTIDMSAFAQDALDYAWDHDVLVVASMADENARHHNFPVTANHTLPVHAITMQSVSEESTTATSYFAFNNCTNFGAQNFLSASGLGCSSEGAGRLGGVSGLVYSMALEAGLDPPLEPGEAQQILLMTAEDIDVPESRGADSFFYWSQPGFDQRFGYGRVDANRAVEWVSEGRIPPIVDVVEPYWFDVLYADRGTVEIHGTVSASRADSYDYFIEWAPGVQPLDDAYTVIEEVTNVPASTVTGSDGAALAELDPSTIDPTHEPDPDSPFGENRFTITVRVRAVAHYGGAIGDVRGEMRRAYYVLQDPDLLPGFPIRTADSLESSPKLVDLDGDGVRDIVQATGGGEIWAWKVTDGGPVALPGFPARVKHLDGLDGDATRTDYRSAPAYGASGVGVEGARESITASPAIADLDGDGAQDIVIVTTHGTVYVFDAKGEVRTGWPVRLPDVPSCPTDREHVGELCMGVETGPPPDNTEVLKTLARGAFGSPVLEDLDGDGTLEIIQAAFDGFVHVFEPDGTTASGWPVRVHYPGEGSSGEFNRILTTPAVADLNGDGTPDIVVGSNERLGSGKGAGAFYALDGRGKNASDPPYLPNWPVSVVSFNLFPVVAEGATVSPIVATVKPDEPHVIIHGNASPPFILPGDPGTQSGLGAAPTNAHPERIDDLTLEKVRGLPPTSLFGADSKARSPDTMFPLFAQPSAGDLNQDGVPDVVTSGGSLSVAQNLLSSISTGTRAQFLMSMWNGKTGDMMPASPIPLEDFSFFNNPTIADLTGDGYPEAVTGTGGYSVRAVDACGREAAGFPKFTGQWIIASVALGDVSGDGNLDAVVGSRSGYLYAWKTSGKSTGVVAWESYHHDNRNTGNYDVPLEQGKLRGAKKPLAIKNGKCAAEEPPAEGCGCRTPSRNRAARWSGLLAVVLGGLAVARRRRERV